MNENKIEQIKQGFYYIKNLINTIEVKGIDNCQKLTAIYNNIDVFLNMIANGEISITECEEKGKQKTQSSSSAIKKG